jgi:hypothetical protein
VSEPASGQPKRSWLRRLVGFGFLCGVLGTGAFGSGHLLRASLSREVVQDQFAIYASPIDVLVEWREGDDESRRVMARRWIAVYVRAVIDQREEFLRTGFADTQYAEYGVRGSLLSALGGPTDADRKWVDDRFYKPQLRAAGVPFPFDSFAGREWFLDTYGVSCESWVLPTSSEPEAEALMIAELDRVKRSRARRLTKQP